MRRAIACIVVAALAAALAASPAAAAPGAAASPGVADTLIAFRSPSGNIGCLFIRTSGRPSLRCDLAKLDRPARKPASCHFDYGNAFGLSLKGRARRLCVSDSALDQSARAIPYGHTRRLGKFLCVSRRSGMRCTAPSGHGFRLSRRSQRLF